MEHIWFHNCDWKYHRRAGIGVGGKIFSSHQAPPPKPNIIFLPGKLLQCGLFTTVSSGSFNQAAPTGLHNPDPALDIRTIIQSAALRLLADCDALLYLCHYRNAGNYLPMTVYRLLIIIDTDSFRLDDSALSTLRVGPQLILFKDRSSSQLLDSLCVFDI